MHGIYSKRFFNFSEVFYGTKIGLHVTCSTSDSGKSSTWSEFGGHACSHIVSAAWNKYRQFSRTRARHNIPKIKFSMPLVDLFFFFDRGKLEAHVLAEL